MPDTIPESDVVEALAVLRESLEVGGYGLSVGVDGPRLRLEVTATSAACSDCLIPADMISAIVSSTLADQGIHVDPDAIEIIYPPQGADGSH